MDKPKNDGADWILKAMVAVAGSDGQLDDCDLTLRDVQRIKDAFCELLLGVYHERIPYPEDRIARIPQRAASDR